MVMSAQCPQTLPRKPANVSERWRKLNVALTCDFTPRVAHMSTRCEPLCEAVTALITQRSQVQILPPLQSETAGHPCRSGAGQECWPVFRLVRDVLAGAPIRGRGQGSGVARPRSGRRALTAIPFGASCGVVAGRCPSCRGVVGSGGCGSHQGRRFRWEQAWCRSVIPSRRPARAVGRGRMMGCAPSWGLGRSGSIRTLDLAANGGHDLHDPRPTE